jgi:hypothetical protein
MNPTRRLAAILAADVAGYSRLIAHGKPGTSDALNIPKLLSTIAAHRKRRKRASR